MRERATYSIASEPSGPELRNILYWAANLATQLGVVVHSSRVKLQSKGTGFFNEVGPYLIDSYETNEWPGTRLVGSRLGIVRTYSLTRECADIFLNTSDRLYMWVNPYLPEDPHLLRADGSVLLGTITQERDCWMELHKDEYSSLVRDVPWTARALKPQS